MGEALTGGCLCGGVRFSYGGVLGDRLGAVTVCYCSQCRKAQGFAVAVAPGQAAAFAVTRGASLVSEYQSSPGKYRAFCAACGSPLYSRRDDRPEALRLRLGAFDQPPETLRVQARIHTASQPAWIEHLAEAPEYPGAEPGRP